MASVKETINILQNLDKNVSTVKTDPNTNQEICRLIKLQIKDFFRYIYIPMGFFRDDNWEINKILYENKDCLFYNKIYLNDKDEAKFDEVFNKYVTQVESILSKNNLLLFLKKWTNMTEENWTIKKNNSYLRTVINNYPSISPLYISNFYCSLYKSHEMTDDKVKTELEKNLNGIMKNVKKEIKNFTKIYDAIIESYVYKYPISNENFSPKNYVHKFLNTLLLSILDFCERLLCLNIYTLHPIVLEIINYYTPLDEINTFDPAENGNRKLYIV